MTSIPYPPGVSATRTHDRVQSSQRHTRRNPCPICDGGNNDHRGHGTRCAGFSDEGWAYCTREEFAGALQLNEHTSPPTYKHRLSGDCWCGRGPHDGPTTPTPPRGTRQDREPEAERDTKVYHGPYWATYYATQRTATFTYQDATGGYVFDVLRYESILKVSGDKPHKDFLQARRLAGDTWVWGLGGVERVLYCLPELLTADPRKPVFIPEGEKAVEALRALGAVATCNPGGAGKWDGVPDRHEALRGRHVVILPDNDPERPGKPSESLKGQRHAAAVAADLRGVAASVRVLMLPGLPEKGDVVEWLDAGGTYVELLELALTTPAEPGAPAGGAEGGEGGEASADPLDAQTANRHLKALLNIHEQIDSNPNLPPGAKDAARAAIRMYTHKWRADPNKPIPIYMPKFGEQMGCGAKAASQKLDALEKAGGVKKVVNYTTDAATGLRRPHISIVLLPQLLEHPDQLAPEQSGNGWGGKRERRCTSCGSANLETVMVCRDCGVVLSRKDVNPPQEEADTTALAQETCPAPQDDGLGELAAEMASPAPQDDREASTDMQRQSRSGSGEPAPIDILRQTMHKDRAEVLRLAELHGWERLTFRQGTTTGGDQATWERFTAGASEADVRAVLEWLSVVSAVG